jgi:hypothetical protein
MFQTNVVEKIKTHILCSVTFFRKSCRLWDNVEKHGRARQAIDNRIRRMRFACWLTLRICNTYCFSSATVVSRTRLSVTFIRRLYCFRMWKFVMMFTKLRFDRVVFGLTVINRMNETCHSFACLTYWIVNWKECRSYRLSSICRY